MNVCLLNVLLESYRHPLYKVLRYFQEMDISTIILLADSCVMRNCTKSELVPLKCVG